MLERVRNIRRLEKAAELLDRLREQHLLKRDSGVWRVCAFLPHGSYWVPLDVGLLPCVPQCHVYGNVRVTFTLSGIANWSMTSTVCLHPLLFAD
jgi:hypothetical protein